MGGWVDNLFQACFFRNMAILWEICMFHHCLGEVGSNVNSVFRKRKQEDKGGGTEEFQKEHGCVRRRASEEGSVLSTGTERSVSLGPDLNADLQGAELEEDPRGCGLNEDSDCARMDSLASACVS